MSEEVEVLNEKENEIKEEKHKKKNKKDNLKDEKIKLLEDKINELTDKNVRVQAEFLNYKNRTQNEISNMFKYEGESLIKNILEVVDDFERAIQMDDNDLSDEVSMFLKGFKMIYTRLIGILDNLEVKEIDCIGNEFNPEVAEAVLTEHDENKPENVVLEVLKKGYTYKDKLIRPAMVKVNK